MLTVGLTGGIGSGKSTVSAILRTLGVPVYDSDSRAKALMTDSVDIRNSVIAIFGEESYSANGELNRSHIASRAFTDPRLLSQLNAAVHPAVMNDFSRWASDQPYAPYVVQENAILFESGFDKDLDLSVTVSAPEQERIQRACKRDGITEEKVIERIQNQSGDSDREAKSDFVLHNADSDLLLPQVIRLHSQLVRLAAQQKT